MVDVILDKIKHIPGVPQELLGEALEAGALDANKVFGLIVFLPEKPEEKIYVELILNHRKEISLLKKNAILPIEQAGTSYRLLPCWRSYVGLEYTPPAV